jgi:hypothetical protein
MKLYMFRTVRLSIIRSLFSVHSAMVYVIQVCRQLSSRSICSCSKGVCTVPVWHIPLLNVQWINSWWWTEELPKTFRVSCQNKFVKLVHLVGFIIKKFVTMHVTSHGRKKDSTWRLSPRGYISVVTFNIAILPLNSLHSKLEIQVTSRKNHLWIIPKQ